MYTFPRLPKLPLGLIFHSFRHFYFENIPKNKSTSEKNKTQEREKSKRERKRKEKERER